MNQRLREVVIVALCGVLGALGCLLFGASPAAVLPAASAEPEWELLGMRVPDFDSVDAAWLARAPWGALPKPVEPEAPPPPPPPPPPIPVGIVGAGRGAQAIFMVHGTGDVRVAIGGALPDGGRLLGVTGMKVDWIDGQGQRQERRLFIDPAQLPAGNQVP